MIEPIARSSGVSGGPEPYPVLLPALPQIPPGANPLTYRLGEVERQMRSAFFSLFSVPNAATPDVPIPAVLPFPFSLLQDLLARVAPDYQLLAAVEVNEAPLRFKTTVEEAACQILATNTVGQSVATVHIQWTPIPWDYQANPYTNPPQTILNPLASQRFEMLDGQFRFQNTGDTGLNGFGSGRTFPNFPNGLSLKIGAVIDVLSGVGAFRGHQGIMVVNGVITPPNELDLNIMMRILDPEGNFLIEGPLPPLEAKPFPDPTGTFLVLSAGPDPSQPSTLRLGPDGTVLGIDFAQQLRRIDLDFDVVPGPRGTAGTPKSQVRLGPVVGRYRSTLHFPVGEGSVPVPLQSSGGRFELFDSATGGCFGTIEADLVEGRGFPTVVKGAPMPIYRAAGFGPIAGGTGEFEGASGILSTNALLSLFPRTSSSLYIFRFEDSQGRWRAVTGSPRPQPTF